MRRGEEMWPGDEGPRESGWAFDLCVLVYALLLVYALYRALW